MAEATPQKSAGPWRRRIVVMVRDPVAGAVKTRLARGIGTARATGVYRHTSTNVIERLHTDARWETWLAVTPDNAVETPFWPTSIPRRAQGSGGLGERMQRVFTTMPPGPVLIVGTDIPEINPERITNAFEALGTSDAVFGPAEDGGYWLIGLSRRQRIPDMFANVRWSSPHTLTDTEANMHDLAIAHIDILDDVDDAAAYARIGALGGRRILPIKDRTDS